jgi:hypothetical protein
MNSVRSFLFFLVATSALIAQETRGMLTGRVTDSSGAAVPSATVVATNPETGASLKVTTNDEGAFTLPFLPAGLYGVNVEATGFKKLSRVNIELRVGDRISLDLKLDVGDLKETVTVEDTAPLLDTATATTGQVIDRRRVAELPLADGNPFALARLAAGVNVFGTGFLGSGTQPFSTTDPSSITTNGAQGGNEFTLDGAPNTVDKRPQTGNRIGQQPPADAVQEFKVTTASFDAQQGHTAGATIDVAVRSGTNRLSGTAYEFVRNEVLGANNFFTNRSASLGLDDNGKAKRSPRRYNRFGGTVGGPVTIPGLYKGKDRTFFFASYEGIRTRTPKSEISSTPALDQRAGNFASLLPLGIQIFDPASARQDGARVVRTPFPGNIIPAARINPVSSNFAKFFPDPNFAGDAQGRNNFATVFGSENVYNWILTRFDHTINDRHRIFGRYSRGARREVDENRSGVTNGVRATGFQETRFTNNAIIDHVWTQSASFVVNLRGSISRFVNAERNLSDGVLDPGTLGFSPRTVSQFGELAGLPRFDITGFMELGGRSADRVTHDIYSFQPNLTKLAGKHSMRFGYDFRVYRENSAPPGDVAGRYRFRTDFTRQTDLTTSAQPAGQELAAFLLGLPANNSSLQRIGIRSNQNVYHGIYFQDDWKVSSKLTLNLGGRYEYEAPTTERFNRNVRLFDQTTPNPINDAARAAYARAPIPEIAAANFNARGGMVFATADNRGFYQADTNNIQARLGGAYQINGKTVLRGGYGMYAAPLTIDSYNQSGFDFTTALVPTANNGLTFLANFTDPFPTGVVEPPGAANGLATFVGQTLGGAVNLVQNAVNRRLLPLNIERRLNPMIHRFEASLQRELPGKWVMDLAYIGSIGRDLTALDNLNPVPRRFLSPGLGRDNATVSLLEGNVTNPFRGLPEATGSGLFTQQVVQRQQLLRPFPQFQDVFVVRNDGRNTYHSAQLRMERRMANGFSIMGSYVFSKQLDQFTKLNAVDGFYERRLGDADTPHRITLSGIYEMPFGRGRKWLNSTSRWADGLLGGWQLGYIYNYQIGNPLTLDNIFFNGNPGQIRMNIDGSTVDNVFNTDLRGSGFYYTDASMQTNGQLDLARQIRDPRINQVYNLRTLSSRLPNLRGDTLNNIDVSLIKNTTITERVRLQFRAEVLNVTNQVFFGGLDFNPRNASFGRLTEQVNLPREWQLGLKMLF